MADEPFDGQRLLEEIVDYVVPLLPPYETSVYRDPALRKELFERDGWRCRYCGEPVSPDTATLDHVLPTSRGGTNEPQNLATACLMCNSIKSGRSYEDAAPDMLAALQARRARTSESV